MKSAKAKKWDSRKSVGLYLGPSMLHAGSALLVQCLDSGLASSRFSIVHDDFFETMRYNCCSTQTKSLWQVLPGLDYADTIKRWQKVQKLTSSTVDVYEFINAKNENKGQTNPTDRSQPKEVSKNAIVYHLHVENINLNEAQGRKNDLMPSQSEANDSVASPFETVLKKITML